MTTRETAVAGMLPAVAILATVAIGFGREWLRPVPRALAFAVPVADRLHKATVLLTTSPRLDLALFRFAKR
jgi:hypothetical protein